MKFHTEAGRHVGFGHLRRCLALADAFAENGCACRFLLNKAVSAEAVPELADYPVSVNPELNAALAQGFGEPSDIVVGDSYRFGPEQYKRLERSTSLLVALDDLYADLPVDVVINPSGTESGYAKRPERTVFAGLRYALIRKAFRRPVPDRPARCRDLRVLVTFGGTDYGAMTWRIARALLEVEHIVAVDVVVGPYAAGHDENEADRKAMDTGRLQVHRAPQDIRSLMLRADAAVTAAGQTLFELAACATPVVVVQTADNQRANVDALTSAKAALFAGVAGAPDVDLRVVNLVKELLMKPEARVALGNAGRALIDGFGAQRAARECLRMLESRVGI